MKGPKHYFVKTIWSFLAIVTAISSTRIVDPKYILELQFLGLLLWHPRTLDFSNKPPTYPRDKFIYSCRPLNKVTLPTVECASGAMSGL